MTNGVFQILSSALPPRSTRPACTAGSALCQQFSGRPPCLRHRPPHQPAALVDLAYRGAGRRLPPRSAILVRLANRTPEGVMAWSAANIVMIYPCRALARAEQALAELWPWPSRRGPSSGHGRAGTVPRYRPARCWRHIGLRGGARLHWPCTAHMGTVRARCQRSQGSDIRHTMSAVVRLNYVPCFRWALFVRGRRPMVVQYMLDARKRLKGPPQGGPMSIVVTDIEDFSSECPAGPAPRRAG